MTFETFIQLAGWIAFIIAIWLAFGLLIVVAFFRYHDDNEDHNDDNDDEHHHNYRL